MREIERFSCIFIYDKKKHVKKNHNNNSKKTEFHLNFYSFDLDFFHSRFSYYLD